jgi:excisionase family DNA binding protein
VPDQPAPLVYELPEVAHVARLSHRQVQRLIAMGDIRSFKIGRRRLVLVEDLEQYLRNLAHREAA